MRIEPNNMGIMYRYGKGVTEDFHEAVRWYRLAAVQGHAGAQSNLGSQYFDGRGIPQDYVEASNWFRLAAVQGRSNAQVNLGQNYYHGMGVIQDFVTAHMWFNIASAIGDERAAGFRSFAANVMTPQQVAEAQGRARVCMASDYQDCG
jgi:TPR repeat protein